MSNPVLSVRASMLTWCSNRDDATIYNSTGPLTEETFGKMPLDFVGNSILRWGGDKDNQIEFNTTEKGWETNVGTTPPGEVQQRMPG